jgi:hypothetical protein
VIQSVDPPGSSVTSPGRTWGLLVTVLKPSSDGAAEVQTLAAQAAALNYTAVTYETFIPDKYLSAPPAGCGSYNGSEYSFGGDNRGFQANSDKYRTRQAAMIGWNASGAVTTYRYIGTTHVYRT